MKILLLLGLVFVSKAFAVMDSNLTQTFKAVVALKSPNGLCTGTVVGLHPPTVITARHCVEMSSTNFNGFEPEDILKDNFESSYFSTERAQLPGDMAVLIYSFKAEKEFRAHISEADLFAVGSEELLNGQKAFVCGYGSTARDKGRYTGIGTQRCGTNLIIKSTGKKNYSAEANAVLASNPSKKFQEFYPPEKAKYAYSLLQSYLTQYGPGTRYGIGALIPSSEEFPYGQYDEGRTGSLTQEGDSGGPVFVQGKSGQNMIVSITSGALSADNLYVGSFSWRVDHKWSKALLRKAYNYGADIKGIQAILSEEKP